MEWYILLIKKFGYLAILLGTLVEGELFLALGGIFAQQNQMNMWVVVAMAVIGSFISHTLFFLLGRWRGPALIRRFPKLQSGYPRAQALAQRFGPACIFVVQYLYGMRLVTCLTLGTLRMGMTTFVIWQLISCNVWAIGLALLGYLLGAAIESYISRVEVLLTLCLTGGLVLVGGYRWLWKWAQRSTVTNKPGVTRQQPLPGGPPLTAAAVRHTPREVPELLIQAHDRSTDALW